jgi:hypothetical protein
MAATISITSSSAHVNARPQAGGAEMAKAHHGDEPGARRLLGVNGNGVLEVAKDDVDLRNELGHLGADLLDVRRNEVDHPLQPQGQFTQRCWRANRKRFKKIARQFHRQIRIEALMLRYGAKLIPFRPASASAAKRRA